MLQLPKKPYYRHLCALGGVVNILMMMGANLVGFVLGTDGTREVAERLVGSWEGMSVLLLSSLLHALAHSMFFDRVRGSR